MVDKTNKSNDTSLRKTAKFNLAYDDSNSDSDNNLHSRKTSSIEDSALKALNEAVENIVDKDPNKPILGVTGDKYFEQPTPLSNELGMVNVHRPIYSQSRFNKVFGKNIVQKKPHKFFDSVFMPITEKRTSCEIVFSLFPLLNVLKTYNFRSYFPLDLLSGLTTGFMRIPQSMAYALLAHLAPVSGLYTAFFSAVLYPIFGGSHHMAAGAQGVVSLLIGGGVIRALTSMNFDGKCNQTSTTIHYLNVTGLPSCSDFIVDTKVNIAITITFMVGIWQCLLGICRFGFLTNYLSDPLIGGYTTAAACTVVISQFPLIFGVKTKSFTGPLNSWYLIIDFFKKLPTTNVATFLISVVCLLVLALSKYLSSRFSKTLKIPIPGELLVMVGSIMFSSFSKADELWKIRIVGTITPGFMPPRLPTPIYMWTTIEASFSAAIVSFAIGYSISKRMALQHDYEINGNQEIFAFGFMNSIGSFFNCFAATASMSASALNESLGGVSQIANLIASVLILLALLFIGPLFASTPKCVLSTIIIINLKGILFQFGDLPILWKVSKIDFLLWVVTFLSVITLDVDIGLGLGVMFSLLTIVFRTQWPYICLLGRIPYTDIYKNINLTADAEEVSGIKVFRFEGSLYFASAEHFRNSIQKETGLNAMKILNSKRDREKKLLKVKKLLEHDNRKVSPSMEKLIDRPIIDRNTKDIHHIIIDFSTCSFIDSVGVRTIMQVINDYKAANIIVFLANVRAAVLAMFRNSSVLYKTVNAKHIFLSVHDAVLGALEDAQYMNERNYIIRDATIKSVTRCVSRIASDPEISQSFKFH